MTTPMTSDKTSIPASQEDINLWTDFCRHVNTINENYSTFGLTAENTQPMVSIADRLYPSEYAGFEYIRDNIDQVIKDMKIMLKLPTSNAAEERGDTQDKDAAASKRLGKNEKDDAATKRVVEWFNHHQLILEHEEDGSIAKFEEISSRLSEIRRDHNAELTEADLGILTKWVNSMSPDMTIWGDGTWTACRELNDLLKGVTEGTPAEKSESAESLRVLINHLPQDW